MPLPFCIALQLPLSKGQRNVEPRRTHLRGIDAVENMAAQIGPSETSCLCRDMISVRGPELLWVSALSDGQRTDHFIVWGHETLTLPLTDDAVINLPKSSRVLSRCSDEMQRRIMTRLASGPLGLVPLVTNRCVRARECQVPGTSAIRLSPSRCSVHIPSL